MSTELPQLSDADRVEIHQIMRSKGVIQWSPDACEHIARHFIGVGLERAAVICDTETGEWNERISAGKGEWPKPNYVQDEIWARWQGAFGTAQALAANIRRAVKGQP